ncbi:MAG: class A beta-lactamase-related serine hydrolase [Gammaproteobacteria bacterium]|nr:class A beta-lactamase-related serine hydrolase [Gammaproteobacteria bacterium]
MTNKKYLCRTASLLLLSLPGWVSSYPLDGLEESGIRRLQGYLLAQQTPGAAKLWPGQLLDSEQISLRLKNYNGPDFDELAEDPDLASFLAKTLRQRDPSYSMVLIDMTNEDAIRWAGLRPDVKQNAGSVGKLICMAALFHALAAAFPDVGDRARVLRESVSPAGSWVNNEIHKVPKWSDELQRNLFSVIVPSDEFRLGEWLDHAISASANGAGSIIWREAMLIRHFGAEYPKSFEESERFFAETPKGKLAELAQAVVTEPLEQAGIDTANLQQGSFWTGNSKRKVPGRISFATPRELARLLFRIEQGRLVDEWSSLQMKKYMYLTKRRYRYSYAPELGDSAVFFKSGSLYSCRPEEGFRCDKYMGNDRNLMNSVATVEGIGEGQPHYTAVLMSNVLRFNSAWDHSRIGAAVHETIRTSVPQTLRENASEKEMLDSGRSD